MASGVIYIIPKRRGAMDNKLVWFFAIAGGFDLGREPIMTSTFKLFRVREDKQGSFDIGTYSSHSEAEAAIPSAKAELIGQQPVPTP